MEAQSQGATQGKEMTIIPPNEVISRPIRSIPRWLEWRRQNINGSEVGCLFGVGFASPLRLWAEKNEEVAPPEETKAMRRGRWLETGVLDAYVDEKGGSAFRPNRYYHHPEFRLGATPDAFWHASGNDPYDTLIQAKVVARPIFDTKWAEKPPDAYVLQVQAELMLTGFTKGVLAALVVSDWGADLQTYEMEPHPGVQMQILAKVKKYWDDCSHGREPKADYAKDHGLLHELREPRPGETLDLTGDNRMPELLDGRELWKAKYKEAVDAIEAIDAEVLDKIGHAELAITKGWKISHKMQTRRERTVPAASFPVMRITKLKEQE